MHITHNVGWVQTTPTGVRIWQSQRGRYFRDPVHARARETVIRKMHTRRSAASYRREPYLMLTTHLDFNLPRAIWATRSDDWGGAA